MTKKQNENINCFIARKGLSGEDALKFYREIQGYNALNGKNHPLGVECFGIISYDNNKRVFFPYHIKGTSSLIEVESKDQSLVSEALKKSIPCHVMINVMSGSKALNERALKTLEKMTGVELR